MNNEVAVDELLWIAAQWHTQGEMGLEPFPHFIKTWSSGFVQKR